tara:strand:+ start:54808 stop:57375 length:2568 start_codon:yes stop_codon:yes gene_type:complete
MSNDRQPPTQPMPDWEDVQNACAMIPGAEGIERRRVAYAPYFFRMGIGVEIDVGCHFSHPERIVLDDDARINRDAIIYGSGGVWIGRHARIGPRVFIHSANHEIEPSPDAFFERGYNFDSVRIDDNCLLSANVSILPGAQLAAGCFVACGAVVTKGAYPDDSRIMGVPAKGKSTHGSSRGLNASPSIVILTPASGPYGAMADLLAGSLGLPQLGVLRVGQVMPSSVHTVLLSGADGWTPELPEHCRVWHIERGETMLEGAITGAVQCPSKRTRKLVPTADEQLRPIENVCSATVYYASKRLRKRCGNMTDADQLDLHLAIAMLERQDSSQAQRVRSMFIEMLPEASADWPELEQLIIELMHASDTVRDAAKSEELHPFSDRTVLACSELMIVKAIQSPKPNADRIETLDRLIGLATKASQLIHFGLASSVLGLDEQLARCVGRLLSEPMLDEQAMLVRSAEDSTGYCYSPALAALLLIAGSDDDDDLTLRFEETREEQLAWRVLAGSDSEWSIADETHSGRLVDDDRRVVARSLLEQWILSVRVPTMDGHHYEISDDDYRPIAQELEQVWTKLFRRMLHDANEPMVRVRPWPSGYRAALSVRYDIDRNTHAEQVQGIIETHSRLLNSACGSWYRIDQTPFGDRLSELLPRFLQEVGVHALNADESMEGQGVTHHSAPNSQYWRGQRTIEGIEQSKAAYGEMLATQLSIPRKAWLGDLEHGRATRVMLTPLHFPIEGSTSEQDLSYFDQRVDTFRELIAKGGHAIVGCHPDLNPGLLEELLEREDFEGVWCVPIGRAVERCTQIGSVRVVRGKSGATSIVSDHTIADVQVEIDSPGDGVRTQCLQLNAHMPRVLEL